METKRTLGQQVKERLDDTGFEPKKLSWERINATLQKRKRRRFFWYFFTGAVIVVLLLLLSNWLYTSNTLIEVPAEKDIHEEVSKKNLDLKKMTPVIEIENDTKDNAAELIQNTVEKSQSFVKKPLKNTSYDNKIDLSKSIAQSDTPATQTQKKEHLAMDGVSMQDSIDKKDTDTTRQEKKSKRVLKKKAVKSKSDSLEKVEVKKWTISIHATPTYSNYLSESNALLPESINRKKNFKLSWSYRLLFSIPIKERLKFRFGISQLDFKYAVSFEPDPDANNGYGGVMISNVTAPINPLPNDLANDINMGNTVELEHHIRYLQIPMEGVFVLGQRKKTNLDLIAGIDLLILQKDDIMLKSANSREFRIGRANYLNTTAFSGHIGLGISHPFNEHFKLEVEPTLFYQFSGYGDNVQHPSPYYFGIYSGLSFKF
ncbi:MAG: outer membrane beta-barrel protein [Bacteroidota bacterium]